MSQEQAKGEVLFGVSLDDLARVHAAERAGVPTDVRLAELGLDRTAFSRAEQAWLSRLSASLCDEPALLVAYDLALARAVASDAPKILPLEEDLGAWISFEGHFQRAADPGELAKSIGLSLQEVARLHAHWSAKLAADPALAEQATTLRAEPPAPLPTIRRESRRSTPTRGQANAVPLPEKAPVPALSALPAEAPPVILARTAVEPAPSSAPVPPPLAVQLPGSSAPGGTPAPRWDAATMEIDISTLGVSAVPFQSSVPNDQSALRTKEQADLVQPPRTDDESSGATAEIDVRTLMRPALAFGPPAPSPPSVPGTSAASSPPTPAGMGTTGDVPADLLKRIAQGPTPFTKAPPAPATSAREAEEDSITLDDEPSTAGDAPPLPFIATDRPAAAAKPFSAMTTDVPADLVARIAKSTMPFDPHSARPPSPAGTAPPIAPRKDRGTAAMPAVPAADPKLPFAPATKGVRPPAQTAMLTLEQHASLTAELQVFQDRTEAVFAKYSLTDVRQRLATEQTWRERLRKNPDEDKEWRRLHQHYVAYWTGMKRASGKP